MAQKKQAAAARNGRDSKPKMLGVKVFGGDSGSGRHHHRAPARHPVPSRHQCRLRSEDHTLFALADGKVSFAVKGAMNKHTVNVTSA